MTTIKEGLAGVSVPDVFGLRWGTLDLMTMGSRSYELGKGQFGTRLLQWMPAKPFPGECRPSK